MKLHLFAFLFFLFMIFLALCSRSNDYNSIPAKNPYEKDYTALTAIIHKGSVA